MPDPILLWNKIALEADRVAHTNGQGEQTGPILRSRALAIVHLAMYDAFAGITNTAALPRYINNPPSPGGGTAEALRNPRRRSRHPARRMVRRTPEPVCRVKRYAPPPRSTPPARGDARRGSRPRVARRARP